MPSAWHCQLDQNPDLLLVAARVTVNVLAPGTIDTQGMHEEEMGHRNVEVDDGVALMLGDIPAHRLGASGETAAIVLFLASPGARYINGATIVADGALSLSSWTPTWDPEVP
jgi:NAD(P)-dependent dehydrogenase (short-subunit alcohol dehydrogenase family)